MSSSDTFSQGPGSPRRLAAVLMADIKDYSRLMGRDEDGTAARVALLHRDVADPLINGHRGRLIKTMGDGLLAVFDSPLDALLCALALQKNVTEKNADLPNDQRLQYRIGINLGDIIVAAHDIYGDSVNIAARIQLLAEPGGVCVSGSVYDQIKNRIDCGFLSLGDEALKNIADPVRVYRVVAGSAPAHTAHRASWSRAPALAALVLAAGAAGWLAWTGLPHSTAAKQSALANPADLSSAATPAEQRREIIFQRMAAVLSNGTFAWRTVERLATVAGVTEPEAHDILAAHQPLDVVLGKSKHGKLIARLAEH